MKRLVILSIIVLFSCSKNKKEPIKIARENIENALMKTLHDPDSYEFVELSEFDTLSYKAFYENMYETGMSGYERIVNSPKHLTREKLEKKFYGNMNDPGVQALLKKVDSLNTAIQDRKMQMKKYKDSITGVSEKKIKELYTTISFRANNALGQKTINHYDVTLSDSLTLLDMVPQANY